MKRSRFSERARVHAGGMGRRAQPDNRDFEGAGGGFSDGGGLPPSWDQRCNVLQMEIEVWRDGGVGGQAALSVSLQPT